MNFLQGFKKWQVVLGAVIVILTLYFGDSLQKLKSMIALLGGFLMAGRFKFNFKFNPRNAFLFGLGGLLMGFGSRFAKGCNIGALYSSILNFFNIRMGILGGDCPGSSCFT